MNSFAASIVKQGLECLKFAKLILATFWNVNWESNDS